MSQIRSGVSQVLAFSTFLQSTVEHEKSRHPNVLPGVVSDILLVLLRLLAPNVLSNDNAVLVCMHPDMNHMICI
ncbi:uncharacterized protein MYCFIDRAFT_175427 [Pseudocercospora fijiensis CIRAD86]|uniref:Uncharacterized protein n=1 Tax=Pseudocercospora fijiensis (strain CIRAD86) TaxID=383855 RepID=M3AB86_PSEFD|nr:uncharacterized protein MYCFIDRAFT_175427 [Pseudocercospora fijiensis CIRAD86]EME81841.1 hypothetical protein MYCFIDRAFT_175427 [Pseudocercospora fijiensis CIRAD86]